MKTLEFPFPPLLHLSNGDNFISGVAQCLLSHTRDSLAPTSLFLSCFFASFLAAQFLKLTALHMNLPSGPG